MFPKPQVFVFFGTNQPIFMEFSAKCGINLNYLIQLYLKTNKQTNKNKLCDFRVIWPDCITYDYGTFGV